MRRRLSLAGLARFLTLLAASATAAADPADLLVMLQAGNLSELRTIVAESGGTVTHDLPIIHALGARMNRTQLAEVERRSTSIYRVIDDLAYVPGPDSHADCGLSAGLELRWQGATAHWKLFNKASTALELTELRLRWPEELQGPSDDPPAIAAGNTSLTTSVVDVRELIAIPRAAGAVQIPANASTTISVAFTRPPEAVPDIQNRLRLEAHAGKDCQTKLVASYQDPDADSYFPTVAGAALLHSHGVTGANVTVAVLDSGLWEHPALARDSQGEHRVEARFDAIANREVREAFDESGHGTHMTSVLARSERVTRSDAEQPSYRGIAPDAKLVVVKAFDSTGEAGFLDIVRGIQWIVANRDKYDIRVLNLSFSARPRWPYWLDPVNQALMQAWKAGVFIVAAAGNDGPDPMTIGSPGNLPYLLTVGAITDSWTETTRDDDYIPDFSSRGPTPTGHIKPDVLAPGGHIAGLVRPGSSLHEELQEYLLENGDFVMTGTSQAAAIASGIAALLLQLEPSLSNNELKCMMMSSAEPAIEADGRLAYSPFQQGSGLINVQRVLTLGDKTCANAGLDIDADISGESHFEGPADFSANEAPTLPGQSKLIHPGPSEKGLSATRRWGAREHINRLTETNTSSPINWQNIYLEELQRIEKLSRDPK